MQEMNYEGGYRDEPPVAPTYQSVPPPQYNTYNSGPVGQKLSGFAQSNVAGNGASAGHRLALAIVSLILWLFFFHGYYLWNCDYRYFWWWPTSSIHRSHTHLRHVDIHWPCHLHQCHIQPQQTVTYMELLPFVFV